MHNGTIRLSFVEVCPLLECPLSEVPALTVWWLKSVAVQLAPSLGMDVNAIRVTPVVVSATPSIEMDQQLPIFDVSYSCHSYK